MKFSVTIPAYKAKFLKECIESVLAQTYKDFELIIVNDASPEDLTSIVQSFNDPRIRYYINETNCGALNVVDNWNKCLSYATGDYIICMGDDDKLKPNCLQIYNALIEKYPDLDVYHAWTEIIDEHSEICNMQEPRPLYESVYSMIWRRWHGGMQFIGDFLFKTESLRKIGGFYKLPLAWGSDDITACILSAKKGIANTQFPIFQYRVNTLTLSKSGNVYAKFDAFNKQEKWYQDFLHKRPQYNEHLEAIYWQLCLQYVSMAMTKKRIHQLSVDIGEKGIIRTLFWIKHRKQFHISSKMIMYAMLQAIKDKNK